MSSWDCARRVSCRSMRVMRAVRHEFESARACATGTRKASPPGAVIPTVAARAPTPRLRGEGRGEGSRAVPRRARNHRAKSVDAPGGRHAAHSTDALKWRGRKRVLSTASRASVQIKRSSARLLRTDLGPSACCVLTNLVRRCQLVSSTPVDALRRSDGRAKKS